MARLVCGPFRRSTRVLAKASRHSLKREQPSRMSAFHEASSQLLRPLRVAADRDFAALQRMPNLVADVGRACAKFEELAIPEDLHRQVRAHVESFAAGSDARALREAVARLIESAEAWTRPEFAEGLLARSPTALAGVGPKRAEVLASRGIRTIADLIFYLPTRYDDRRALAKVCDLEVGRQATFIGEVKSIDRQSRGSGGRHLQGRQGRQGRQILEAVVGDDTGSVNLKWFRSIASIEKDLERGALFLITGDVKRYRFSKEIVHPELERIDPDGDTAEGVAPAEGTRNSPSGDQLGDDRHRNIVPHYPAPEGIHAKTLRRLIRSALAGYSDLVEGCLPAELVAGRGLPDVGSALRMVHAPDLHADLSRYEHFASAAHERLVLEELYLLQLGLVLRRAARAENPGIAIVTDAERVRAAPQALPFNLTSAQARVWREIAADLARPHPMNRLLQGDVGSGKTAVALLAAVAVAASGRQTALMAPTELLAEQHALSMQALTGANQRVLGLRIGLLTASRPWRPASSISWWARKR